MAGIRYLEFKNKRLARFELLILREVIIAVGQNVLGFGGLADDFGVARHIEGGGL